MAAMHEKDVHMNYKDEDKRKVLEELLEYWEEDKLKGFTIQD